MAAPTDPTTAQVMTMLLDLKKVDGIATAFARLRASEPLTAAVRRETHVPT
jgi:hypothetical protein